jgi:hypothetical protein
MSSSSITDVTLDLLDTFDIMLGRLGGVGAETAFGRG